MLLMRQGCINQVGYLIKRQIFTTPLLKNVHETRIFIKKSPKNSIGPIGWFLLLIPTATFTLGTWQVQRKQWKENLIRNLKDRTNSTPVKLPISQKEIESLEYYPVHVKGHFQHDKEIHMGPRSYLVNGDSSTESSLLSKGQNTSQGYWIITPFKLLDRDETILINRGWVPLSLKDPTKRQEGQAKGAVDVIGVVRLHEERPNFVPKNNPEKNSWFYRDLNMMGTKTNSSPVLIDATTDFNIPGGPIGGQTRISLRNEHLSYIFTWYTLCGCTSFMWYRQFIKKLPLM